VPSSCFAAWSRLSRTGSNLAISFSDAYFTFSSFSRADLLNTLSSPPGNALADRGALLTGLRAWQSCNSSSSIFASDYTDLLSLLDSISVSSAINLFFFAAGKHFSPCSPRDGHVARRNLLPMLLPNLLQPAPVVFVFRPHHDHQRHHAAGYKTLLLPASWPSAWCSRASRR